MITITRTQAIVQNLPQYFTGKPCRHGHLCNRYVADWRCVKCAVMHASTWSKANPEKIAATAKRVYARRSNDPAFVARRRVNSRKHARKHLPRPTRAMPLTCECCGGGPKLGGTVMHLDHDHRTGAFRGWLCGSCNVGIGALGDDIAGLEHALAYLKRVQS